MNTYNRKNYARDIVMPIVRTPFTWQLAAIATISVTSKVWLGSQQDAGEFIRAMGAAAPLGLVILQASMAMTPMGSSLIPIVNGMFFPLALAVSINLAGAVLSGVTLYYVWRRGQRDLQIQERLRSMPVWALRFVRTDLRSLIVMRYVPFLGCNMANLLAGSHRVPLHIHVVSVVVGALPGSIIYALVGAGIIAL